jgi:hypothetical protein
MYISILTHLHRDLYNRFSTQKHFFLNINRNAFLSVTIPHKHGLKSYYRKQCNTHKTNAKLIIFRVQKEMQRQIFLQVHHSINA